MGNVPLVTEDASPEFVTRALRSTGVIDTDTEVAEVEHDRIGEGVGLLCNLARLTLRYSGAAFGAPSSLILKVPSDLPENRGVGDHFGFYEREGRFYAELGESLPVRVPHCYFNHIDPEANEFALMIEDFGGRTMVSQVAGIGFDRAAESLRALALVHAEWWESPKLDTLTWLPKGTDPIMLSAGGEYRKALPTFVDLFGSDLPDGAVQLGERVGRSYEDIATSLSGSPTTICHGDFRADNLMFDDGSTGREHVGIIDWQIAMRNPGIGDVCYLITQSMTTEGRRQYERDLLEVWYSSLSSALGSPPEGYPVDTAWDDYRAATAMMTVYSVVAGGGMDPSNDRGKQLVTEMANRSFAAALDLDAAALLPA
jgi:Phosphotransferase enzyme family